MPVVERVVRAVEFTPLPNAPPAVVGVINLQGRVVPVVSLRRRLGLRDRELELDDELLVVHDGPRTLALWVDSVQGVVSCPPQAAVGAADIAADLPDFETAVKLADGLVLVQDLARLLSPEERRRYDEADGDARQPQVSPRSVL